MFLRFTFFCFFFFVVALCFSQDIQGGGLLTAVVKNAVTKQPMGNVNILNIDEVKGAVTDMKGEFTISASLNDTLFFSYVGFKSIKVKVTHDMFRFRTQIDMTESIYALEEVVVRPYKLTGDLYLDAKNAPIEVVPVYSISGLPYSGYQSPKRNTLAYKIYKAVTSPVDALYNLFSNQGKSMRKLIKIRKDHELRKLLASKFDREMLIAFLNIDKGELESVLLNCNYSKSFIQYSNDLQILEAISDCYEEYNALKNASG